MNEEKKYLQRETIKKKKVSTWENCKNKVQSGDVKRKNP